MKIKSPIVKEKPLIARTFRLYAESIEQIETMPDRNAWIRNLVRAALTQQKAA